MVHFEIPKSACHSEAQYYRARNLLFRCWQQADSSPIELARNDKGRSRGKLHHYLGVACCIGYRYTIQSDQDLPASRDRKVLPHRIEGGNSGEARRQAEPATVCSRQCQNAPRYERSGIEVASSTRRTHSPLGGVGKRELASDFQI